MRWQNQRTPIKSGDQKALFETFWCPLGGLLGLSWGTVGAYQLDMLKKQESSATAVKQCPAAGGQALWETMSKQVYLEGLKKKRQQGSQPPT